MVTLGEKQLAQTIEYLRGENRILRSKLPKRVPTTPRERSRLLRYGKRLGTEMNSVISIVSPRTFARWVSGEKRLRKPGRTPGRPRTRADIRELVLRLARETGWGYTRILGELKKLGIRSVCRSTVINILREGGSRPRAETWRRHLVRIPRTSCRHVVGQRLSECENLDPKGLVDLYILLDHPRRTYLARWIE